VTRKQRAAVVELLRCAADINNLFGACVELDCLDLEDYAHAAAMWVVHESVALDYDCTWDLAYLEAAQRVEEGSFPP